MVLSQGLHQFVERLVEFRDAFVFKLLSHFGDADPEFRQSLQYLDLLPFISTFSLLFQLRRRESPIRQMV